jgi:hypothetical protein
MYLSVRNYGNLNEAVAKNIPKFASSFVNLQNIIAEIQLIGEMQGINKTGLAIDKNKLKKKLIALALKNSNKVAILAKLNNNDTLLKEVRFTESDLVKLPGVTLKEQVQIIYDRVEANIGNLAEQGTTPDTQKMFLETITAFNNALATPRTGIAEKRKATQKLPVLFDAADTEIEIMDLAAGSVKDEYPDFFNGYKTSRKLIETSSGSLALKATAIELTNREPLSDVKFIFIHEVSEVAGSKGNGQIVKKTSKKGNFQVKSMEPGTYKVEISKQGFKNKEISVRITDGERSELIVELEKA